MRWQIPLVVALALFVAVSCDQQPVEPQVNQFADAPTFKIGDGPAESGIVVRGEYNDAFSWPDFKNEMRVTIGFDMDEFCADIFNFDLIAFHDIAIPDRPLAGPAYGEDMRTAVWPFTDFDCELFTTVEPLATGLANLIITDNDLFGVEEGDKNANSWGFRAHGHLMRPGDVKAAFSAHLNLIFGNSAGFKVNRKISLH